jgi:large subunit ribosomal protein L2
MSPLKIYKPTTPGRRKASVITGTAKGAPHKSLVKGAKSQAGRSSAGSITVRHRGGGVKKKLRTVDMVQDREIPATVERIEYDPNRTSHLALICYADGRRSYILAEETMREGQQVQSGAKAPVKTGNRMPMSRIPAGSSVYNIQLAPKGNGTFVRAAGASATLMGTESGYALLKLPSGEVRRVHEGCLATIGTAANRRHADVRIGKAGRNRLKGKRPHVRGKAMNPVDHPHGGGEGGSPIGLPGPKTPSGLYTLGRKTRTKAANKARAKKVVRSR